MKTNYEHIKKFAIELQQRIKRKNIQVFLEDLPVQNPKVRINKSVISLEGKRGKNTIFKLFYYIKPYSTVVELKKNIKVKKNKNNDNHK